MKIAKNLFSFHHITPYALLVALLILLLPSFSFGCTPIMVGIVFLGPIVLGSIVLSSAIGILLAVGIKIIVFLIMSDYKSVNIVWMILLANVVSTVYGFGIAISTAGSILIIFTMAIAFGIFLLMAKNFKRHKILMKYKPVTIAFGLTVILFFNTLLYGIAQSTLDFGSNTIVYWILKTIASILAIGLSLLLSVIVEESVIAALYKKITKDQSDKNFLRPVLWGNLIAFLVIFGIGAIKSLPTRLRTPGFLNPRW